MTEFEHNWEESNVEKEFIYENRPCVVVQNPEVGHFCGYTKTTLPTVSHQAISYNGGKEYIKLLKVHGGITYGVDDKGWVGFDCGHAGDVCWKDDEVVSGQICHNHRDENTKDWVVEDAAIELRKLADQLSALEQYLESVSANFNKY